MTPPFLTASFKSASAAVVPCVPQVSRPISSSMRATLSPTAGVGARERSTMPKGTPRRRLASWATSWPMRVTRKAVFLIGLGDDAEVRAAHRACSALMDDAGAGDADVYDRVRLADAVEGAGHEGVVLDGVAEDDELGAAEAALRGGELRGLLDDAAHEGDGVHVYAGLGGADVDGGADQLRLGQLARGMERISLSSAGVMPFCTRAEKPPTKLTPVSRRASSRASAKQT